MRISPIENVNHFIQDCLQEGISVYIITEGAGDNCIAKEKFFSIKKTSLYFNLYSNTDFEKFIKISPILIKIDKNCEYIDWFIEHTSFHMQGIIIITKSNFIDTVRHLQKFIEVRMDNYNFAVFRYYNPLVFNRYIRSITNHKKNEIIGPLLAIIWPYMKFKKKENGYFKETLSWCALHRNNEPQNADSEYPIKCNFIELSNETITKMEEMRCAEILEKIEKIL